MKTCSKCKEVKPLDAFHRASRYKDGRAYECKTCCCARAREYQRKQNPEKKREYQRKWAAANKEHVAKRRQEWLAAHPGYAALQSRDYRSRNKGDYLKSRSEWIKNSPQKRAAHISVATAVERRKIIKSPCMICGNPKVHGHHDNYARKLDVVWLCPKHHSERHSRLAAWASGEFYAP